MVFASLFHQSGLVFSSIPVIGCQSHPMAPLFSISAAMGNILIDPVSDLKISQPISADIRS